MTPPDKPDPPGDAPPLSLKRWSQRKHASRRGAEGGADRDTAPATAPSGAGVPDASAVDATTPAAAGAHPAPLPPVDSLTPESDFTRFFDAKTPVDDVLKRAALKTLLRDPRFNVMDGLDTYVGDYTLSDPIPEGVLQRLVQAQSFVTPSSTPGADLALRPVDAVLAAPAASIPPSDPPVAAAEPASPTSAAKANDDPADADKPTTT